MKGKLWLINLALIGLIGFAGWKLRQNWEAAQARERALLSKSVPQPAPPVVPVPPKPGPVTGASFLEVAEKLLFSRDRNPTVVLEVEAPKPVPPFPRFHGVMDLGAGPSVILTAPGKEQKSYKLGEQVGDFKLVSVSRTGIVFEWEGKQLLAKLEDITDRQPIPEQAPQQTAAAAAPRTQQGTTTLAPSAPKPGADLGGQVRGCDPNDSSPSGTVADGFRKVVTENPFGKSCRWEPIR